MKEPNIGFDNGNLWYESKTPVDAPLTKRERFAMAAMQGILTNAVDDRGSWILDRQLMAEESVAMADALLAELEKGKDND